jgi:hypothetical protein
MPPECLHFEQSVMDELTGQQFSFLMNSHVTATFEKEITRNNIRLVTNQSDKKIQIE